jgi:hypothetical protein
MASSPWLVIGTLVGRTLATFDGAGKEKAAIECKKRMGFFLTSPRSFCGERSKFAGSEFRVRGCLREHSM